jgi:hypothetical protein
MFELSGAIKAVMQSYACIFYLLFFQARLASHLIACRHMMRVRFNFLALVLCKIDHDHHNRGQDEGI